MNFELKIQAPQNKPVIWNYEELRSELEIALADFSSRVYTEDMIAEAKEDRAKLNKLKSAINSERISREREYMLPFAEFKQQAKELCDLIEEATSGIASQIDAFEEKRIAEKREKVQTLFSDIASNYDLPFITLDKIYDAKWDNKSVSEKTIADEITAVFEKALKDIEVIKKMPYAFEAEQAYKDCLDLNKALAEGERTAEIALAKRQDALAQAQKRLEGNMTEEAFEISFKCRLTKSQAVALKAFCNENGIKLEQI